MKEYRPPSKLPAEDREIDYLICQQCNTPCYVFEMDDAGAVGEAQCLVCGNDDIRLFILGEDAGSDDA